MIILHVNLIIVLLYYLYEHWCTMSRDIHNHYYYFGRTGLLPVENRETQTEVSTQVDHDTQTENTTVQDNHTQTQLQEPNDIHNEPQSTRQLGSCRQPTQQHDIDTTSTIYIPIAIPGNLTGLTRTSPVTGTGTNTPTTSTSTINNAQITITPSTNSTTPTNSPKADSTVVTATTSTVVSTTPPIVATAASPLAATATNTPVQAKVKPNLYTVDVVNVSSDSQTDGYHESLET